MTQEVCPFCTLPMNEEAPIMELYCRHKVHTKCAVVDITYQYINDNAPTARCPTCQISLEPPEWVQLAEDRAVAMEIEYQANRAIAKSCVELEENSPLFVKDIQAFVAQYKEFKKKKSKFLGYLKQKKNEFDTHTKDSIKLIKGHLKDVRTKIKDSEEYKNVLSPYIRYKRQCTRLSTRWDITQRDIIKHLTTKYKLPNIYYWRDEPAYMIRKKFRF
jgi:hypothetical protein